MAGAVFAAAAGDGDTFGDGCDVVRLRNTVAIRANAVFPRRCHCEERSDAAIQ
jgi:hypothetical protein